MLFALVDNIPFDMTYYFLTPLFLNGQVWSISHVYLTATHYVSDNDQTLKLLQSLTLIGDEWRIYASVN